jgi:hypothetical protein
MKKLERKKNEKFRFYVLIIEQKFCLKFLKKHTHTKKNNSSFNRKKTKTQYKNTRPVLEKKILFYFGTKKMGCIKNFFLSFCC